MVGKIACIIVLIILPEGSCMIGWEVGLAGAYAFTAGTVRFGSIAGITAVIMYHNQDYAHEENFESSSLWKTEMGFL